MNKLTALETFKLDIVVEETIEKLDFLDTLKSNMGQEMSEMMSEEISRVMTEQRNLEIKYATLSQKRSQLKGLKNKAELQQVIEDIKDTARDLKESTKALCRVLKDNPDIPGNQSKIRDDRIDLKILLARLVDEIKDLSFAKFRSTVREGLESSDKLKKLKDDEKKTQHEIKSITTEHKENNLNKNSERINRLTINILAKN